MKLPLTQSVPKAREGEVQSDYSDERSRAWRECETMKATCDRRATKASRCATESATLTVDAPYGAPTVKSFVHLGWRSMLTSSAPVPPGDVCFPNIFQLMAKIAGGVSADWARHERSPVGQPDAFCARSDGACAPRSTLDETLYQKWLHCTYQLNAAIFAASASRPIISLTLTIMRRGRN